MVRPDASVSGTYTILAENAAGKKRFDHHVDFETKYPFMNVPLMRHADKKLDDFVDEMLEKIPKKPEEKPVEEKVVEPEKPVEEIKVEKVEVPQPPKPEEIVEALQAVVDESEGKPVVEKPKKKKHHHHKKKHTGPPKIDADLINDGEDEPEDAAPEEVEPYKRKFSTVVHESYEPETFRIYNTKQNLWWSGELRDQTAIEGSKIKLICTVSGPLPIMKWFKNGKPVPWSQTVRNMSGEGIGHVIIEKITRSDAGVYSCQAKNAFNQVETSANIKVIPRSILPKDDNTSPVFTRILTYFYRISEDDLVLDTHVRGTPLPEIKWYKDGVELNKAMDDRYDIVDDHDGGFQFRIHNPKPTDSALYACEAINSVGKAKVTCKVQFSDRDKHTHPKYLYHKESFRQPSLRMSITPEPEIVKDELVCGLPVIEECAGQSTGGNVNVPASNTNGTSGGDQSGSSGDGNQSSGGQNGSSGGDGNEEGDDKKNIPKDAADAPPAEDEDEVLMDKWGNVIRKNKPVEETEEEVEEKAEEKVEEKVEEVVKKEKKYKPRRRRYEDPVEPLLIRDSVS